MPFELDDRLELKSKLILARANSSSPDISFQPILVWRRGKDMIGLLQLVHVQREDDAIRISKREEGKA